MFCSFLTEAASKNKLRRNYFIVFSTLTPKLPSAILLPALKNKLFSKELWGKELMCQKSLLKIRLGA
jgi:hypothetical protein